ncbi:hypothetical protein Ancab_016991 [Ancistrocladus abbreviatus]
MDSIEKGVMELISQYRIGKLVMGGSTIGRYSRKMIESESKKASYVRAQAPAFCHIWFICKGCLIHTREDIRELAANDVQNVGSNSSRSQLVTLLEENPSNRESLPSLAEQANSSESQILVRKHQQNQSSTPTLSSPVPGFQTRSMPLQPLQ